MLEIQHDTVMDIQINSEWKIFNNHSLHPDGKGKLRVVILSVKLFFTAGPTPTSPLELLLLC
mgnify:CR=1 FL=1